VKQQVVYWRAGLTSWHHHWPTTTTHTHTDHQTTSATYNDHPHTHRPSDYLTDLQWPPTHRQTIRLPQRPTTTTHTHTQTIRLPQRPTVTTHTHTQTIRLPHRPITTTHTHTDHQTTLKMTSRDTTTASQTDSPVHYELYCVISTGKTEFGKYLINLQIYQTKWSVPKCAQNS